MRFANPWDLQIINVVAIAIYRRRLASSTSVRSSTSFIFCNMLKRPFSPGRHPNIIDSPSLELRDLFLQPLPMFLICGDIPLEALHHGHILGSWFMFRHFEGLSCVCSNKQKCQRCRQVVVFTASSYTTFLGRW